MAAKKTKRRSDAAVNAARHNAKKSQKGKKRPYRREVGSVVCLLLGALMVWTCISSDAPVLNVFSSLVRGLIGSGIYILPVSLLISFLILLLHDGRPVALRVTCALLLSVTISAIVHLFAVSEKIPWDGDIFRTLWSLGLDSASGGVLGGLAAQIIALLSKPVAIFLAVIALLLEFITVLNMSVASIAKAIKNRPRVEYDEPKRTHPDRAEAIVNHVAERKIERVERRRTRMSIDVPVDDPPLAEKKPQQTQTPVRSVPTQELLKEEKRAQKQLQREKTEESPHQMPPFVPEEEFADEPLPPIAEPKPEKVKKEDALREAAAIEQEIESQQTAPSYQYPPSELLRTGSSARVDGTEEMRQNSERLNDTLASFNIEAQIINVTRGPSVTRYELELSRGTKLSKITNLADDIALSLGASGVRIAAIPDKISVVGIEVPNRAVSTVFAREVIDSDTFRKSKSKISFAVGKDIGGNQIVGDIGKLPHMLIAGTTGSGKSVCMNSLIVSLLYKAQPDEVKLIMVDPKMVELGVYNGIPHLLIPVVTDPKKAAGALQWAVTEMMRRYRTMADAGVRDLDSFNKTAESTGEYEKLPRIVVVIDELADLMLVAAKEVEESICRVAQMGRAAGIHLVIATQRPSADVITGLMKANIPSRIAFAVASAMESRIILDTMGAEKLVGKGDMLYAPLGQGKPKRVQGCFITDDEVQDVVDFVKNSNEAAVYSEEITQEIERKAEQSGKPAGNGGNAAEADADELEGDEMTPAAVEVLLETGQASVSMLQRRLKLGYARAARIMDELEEKGIVGPFEGSKPRQMLITREQWERMKDGSTEEFNQAVEEEIP